VPAQRSHRSLHKDRHAQLAPSWVLSDCQAMAHAWGVSIRLSRLRVVSERFFGPAARPPHLTVTR
jgi:hypothetical protein